MSFSFTQFKSVMNISDISEETYSMILKMVFQYVKTVHAIDIDEYETPDDIPIDLVYAMYSHAKFKYEQQTKSVPTIDSVKNPGGGSVTYSDKFPDIITSTYRMYSPTASVII